MKKRWTLPAFALLVAVACTPMQKQIARTAIDVGLATCLDLHPDEDESALKEICKWGHDLAPLVKELLAAKRKGMAKHDSARRALACPKVDAGK